MSNNQEGNEDLKKLLEKSTFKLTNKYTKVLAFIALAVWLLVVGAWYGNHSATTSSQNNLTNSFASLRNFSGGNSGGANFGGFGGVRASGTVSKVNNSEVTIKLDDPTQINNFKVGDSSRLTNLSGSSNNVPKIPSPSSSKSPNSNPSVKPSLANSGSTGQRGGFFRDPKIQECLKNEGVELTPGQRPDRTDPKVIAAFAKCLPNFGNGGARPSATP